MTSLYKKIIATILLLAFFTVGLSMYISYQNNREQEVQEVQEVQILKVNKEDTIKQRGPRPTKTRLRNGAKQVETPSEALEMAKSYLYRIDSELLAISTDEAREKLLLKKKIVERTIKRLKTKV